MTHGPGKYDDATTAARLSTDALGVALIVIGGRAGSGFSVQGPPELLLDLPTLLRDLADQIESDFVRSPPELG